MWTPKRPEGLSTRTRCNNSPLLVVILSAAKRQCQHHCPTGTMSPSWWETCKMSSNWLQYKFIRFVFQWVSLPLSLAWRFMTPRYDHAHANSRIPRGTFSSPVCFAVFAYVYELLNRTGVVGFGSSHLTLQEVRKASLEASCVVNWNQE